MAESFESHFVHLHLFGQREGSIVALPLPLLEFLKHFHFALGDNKLFSACRNHLLNLQQSPLDLQAHLDQPMIEIASLNDLFDR